mgnify:CR=1 FL=1
MKMHVFIKKNIAEMFCQISKKEFPNLLQTAKREKNNSPKSKAKAKGSAEIKGSARSSIG